MHHEELDAYKAAIEFVAVAMAVAKGFPRGHSGVGEQKRKNGKAEWVGAGVEGASRGVAMASRETTVREYRERINRVIFYIEEHLGEPMNLGDLAKVACFSPHHFHRIFAAFTGEPLAVYVRRLRLEKSALSLLHLDVPITDIALASGYETPSAYSRAFSASFGVSPTEYRRGSHGIPMVGNRLLSLTTALEEAAMMTPDIRTIEPFSVLFVRKTGPYYEAAGAAFGALCGFAGPRGLIGQGTRFIGISHDDPGVTDESKFRYDACLTITRPVETSGEVNTKQVAGGKYAVFMHAGPYEEFYGTYQKIFTGWMPESGHQLGNEPCFEVYLNSPDDTAPQDLRTEIWVPLD